MNGATVFAAPPPRVMSDDLRAIELRPEAISLLMPARENRGGWDLRVWSSSFA
jgi:hypothetical protein